MQLESFTITNFRSVNDSGKVNAAKLTALLGRNESGKSNLLLGLRSLNPAEGFAALNPIKDFPRHRRLQECNDDTPVVSSRWTLTDSEQQELAKLFPRAKGVQAVDIGRPYGKSRSISFVGLGAQQFDDSGVGASIRKIVPAVKAAAAKLENEAAKGPLEQAADQFESDIELQDDRLAWAETAVAALAALRQALAAADTELTAAQEKHVVELETLAKTIAGDKTAVQKAEAWILKKLPIFIYLDEYPELDGHQNIADYLQRKSQNQLADKDYNFEKLCKVAGLKPEELQELSKQNQAETRNQLANRASAVVTNEIRRLWKDRRLTVRFDADGVHLQSLVSDPNETYNVEVNLDERSRGFRWFFSFYITFSADTQGGEAENAILLLDEPGLFLHAKSQSDLLTHFKDDFSNQIIYTTHSPFMVPTHNLDAIRTVNIAESVGTTVTNDPTGDSRTLFPIQAALGYDLSQSLFHGTSNLVVEGVTDYWILSSVSDYLRENKKTALEKELVLTPAGGAQKVSYMVALLTSEQLNVLVLLDAEKAAISAKDELVKSKLIREQNVVFVTEAFGTSPPTEADIEDLLEPSVYEALVQECYSDELKSKTLSLNSNIPRIVKRFEAAFQALGMDFHKTRPARLLLNKMATGPAKIVDDPTSERFQKLFEGVNKRLAQHVARNAGPFN